MGSADAEGLAMGESSMTRAVYIFGGAATGKSTFTARLLGDLPLGPLEDLHVTPNSRGTLVTLRGHHLDGGDGLYLGCMRENFPGTDGLDRASSITGEQWLDQGGAKAYRYILAEGSTLATRRFIHALDRNTHLLLLHFHCEDFVKDLRIWTRGSNQDRKFVLATATRSFNLWAEMAAAGMQALDVDTADPAAWESALQTARGFLFES